MDDDVLGADGGEAVAAEVEDAFGKARRVGREQQVGPVVDDQLLEVAQAQQAVHHEDLPARSASSSRSATKSTQVGAAMPAVTVSRMALPRRRRFSAVS